MTSLYDIYTIYKSIYTQALEKNLLRLKPSGVFWCWTQVFGNVVTALKHQHFCITIFQQLERWYRSLGRHPRIFWAMETEELRGNRIPTENTFNVNFSFYIQRVFFKFTMKYLKYAIKLCVGIVLMQAVFAADLRDYCSYKCKNGEFHTLCKFQVGSDYVKFRFMEQ